MGSKCLRLAAIFFATVIGERWGNNVFDEILEAAPDPIFGMVSAFQADTRPNKISLMVGVFKDDNLQTSLMPVRKIDQSRHSCAR